MMNIIGFVSHGFEGDIVNVEVDLRRGIPGVDIVGLPDSAVREARERIRVSIRNSGFQFPRERVLINLAPAGIKKEGASFDLPLAAAILFKSEQLFCNTINDIMFLGEVELSGHVRGVNGVLSAVSKGLALGIKMIFVPIENLKEAESVYKEGVVGLESISQLPSILKNFSRGREYRLSVKSPQAPEFNKNLSLSGELDFKDLKGHKFLKRALEVAAAGRHHVFMFGPPGSGKTMAAMRISSILPDLSRQEAIEVTRIHSLGGKLDSNTGLILRPPVRVPHHTASREGIIGGGKDQLPGEISLSHRGILFLDEAPEFSKSLLQSLREPLERGRIDIARSDIHYWYPARFQLVMAANPCPCGKLGKDDGSCFCSLAEIQKYWKKVGGALLDRIDIRIPVKSVKPDELMGPGEESSEAIRKRVEIAVNIQKMRFKNAPYNRNSEIPPSDLTRVCRMSKEGSQAFKEASIKLGLSSRACHSVLRVARTIADLEKEVILERKHVLEAVQHRRYGEGDYFWKR